MTARIWTVSNALSVLRLLLTIPIGIALWSDAPGARLAVAAMILLAVVTDLLDGWLARRLNEVTTFGMIVDPLADKAAVAVVATFLMLKGIIPTWFFLLAIGRDALILAGGMYLRSGKGVVLASNTLGKWAVAAVTAYIFFALFLPEAFGVVTVAMLYLSTLMLLLSFGAYLRRFLLVLRNGASRP